MTKSHFSWLLSIAFGMTLCTSSPLQAEEQASSILIKVSTSNGIPQRAGQSVPIVGTLLIVGDDRDRADDDLLRKLKHLGYELHAFFPDMTHEVTSALSFKSAGRGSESFGFKTPALKSTDTNVFVLQLSKPSREVTEMQQIEKKITQRVNALAELIQTLSNKKGAKREEILELTTLRNNLLVLTSKISGWLSDQPALVSEARLPLQVDNQVASSSRTSISYGDYRLSIAYDLGSAIEGEKTKIHAKITNLRAPDSDDLAKRRSDDDSRQRWLARFSWKNNQVGEVGPKTLSEDESITFDYQTEKLRPSNLNEFAVSLFTWKRSEKKGPVVLPFGSLAVLEPVASDQVAPIWSLQHTPDLQHPYVQSAQQISVDVQDGFGLLDTSTLKANLSGTQVDGTAINQDLAGKLQLTSSDQGQSAHINGDMNPLPEGYYTLALHIQDLAGNSAAPDPLQTSFRIDRTPPQIVLSQAANFCTNQKVSNLVASVSDWSPVNNTVSLNGSTVLTNSAAPSSQSGPLKLSFPVSISMTEGQNTFVFTSVDAAGNSTSTQPLVVTLDTIPPGITLGQRDNVFTNQKTFSLPVQIADASATTTQVFQNGTLIATSNQASFTVLATLIETNNVFQVVSQDCAGNKSTVSLNNIYLDSTPPIIALGVPDHQLTRVSVFPISFSVFDDTPVSVSVLQNGTQIYQGAANSTTLSATLREGLNLFEFDAIDAAGNSAVAFLTDITLDDIAPALLSLKPSSGLVLQNLAVPVSGQSNEPLLYAKVNGQSLALGQDGKSFSGVYSAQNEGNATLHWEVSDLAGNISTQNVSINIVLKVLNGDLLSVSPDTDGTHLIIQGAPGAARSGVTVNASASFFNSGSAVSAMDGSFSIRLYAFQQATLTATDPSIGRTDSATVTFGSSAGTLLSGVVRDTQDQPLAGATVTISGTSLSAVTDGSGVFAFNKPVTGDQVLIVDGTTIPQAPASAPQRKFSTTRVAITVGLSQTNVLNRPIYLVPIPQDTTVSTVATSAGGTVTHPDAPGVTLNIAQNSMSLPNNGSSAPIYVATISKDVATVPPLPVAEPKTVVALEPSGTSFSVPVDLTLPNSSNFPPGVEMAILSMNSKKGIWEIDGSAKVSSDGKSIVTKPGQGITHFSLVYAAPLGPVVRAIGAQDQPGADTFNGSLSTSVKLPSYRVLGKDVAPSLVYKSSWAKPSVLLTNLFDIPVQTVTVDQTQSGSVINRIPGAIHKQVCQPSGFLGLGQTCYDNYDDYYENLQYNASQVVTNWYEPDYIVAQFFTSSVVGKPITFSNTPDHPIPNRAVLSYSMDLLDSSSGTYLSSGIYPYQSSYELHIKELTLRTKKAVAWSAVRTPQIVQNDTTTEAHAIDQLFPENVTGNIHVQNKINSPAGRGWKIAGVQSILNPNDDRIVIEEADGSIADYTIENTISTLFDANGGNIDLTMGVDLSSWPNALLTYQGGAKVGRVNLTSSSSLGLVGAIQPISGTFAAFDAVSDRVMQCTGFGIKRNCTLVPGAACGQVRYNYQYSSSPSALLQLPDGSVVGADLARSSIFQLSGGTDHYIAGGFRGMPAFTVDHYSGYDGLEGTPYSYYTDSITPFCQSNSNLICVKDPSITPYDLPGQPTSACGNGVSGSGQIPFTGFIGDGALANNALNRPMAIIPGTRPNTFVVADTGNHRVRLLDLGASTITTIAGNGQSFDSGDGALATSASIFHPRGLAYDSVGNLYISSENGLIRKVDATGTISTIAGLPAAGESRVLADSVVARQAFLLNPYGLVFDNAKNFLYVADTGHHRVVRIDFTSGMAVAVAGNSSAGYNGDDQAALSASLYNPSHLGLDSDGNLIINDSGNSRIRRVIFQNASSGALAFSATALTDKSKLVRHTDGTWTRTYRNGTFASFDSAGHQLSTQDRLGRATRYNYDTNGRLTSVTDPSGRSLQYNYSGNQLSSITDPANRTTTFNYDSGNNLTSVVFPDGNKKRFTYDANGLMLSETDQRGSTVQYAYNNWSRLASVTQPNGARIAVNDSGSATAGNNFTGGTSGQMASYGTGANQVYDGVADAKSVETKFVKDFRGYVTTIIDGAGGKTTVQRDQSGNITQLTRPDGSIVTYTYNSNSTDPNQQGDLISQSDSATGITTSQTFDTFGNLLTKTNGRGFTSVNQYDSHGLLSKTIDPKGNSVAYTYNSLGEPTSVTNALQKTTSYAYDSAGNMISMTDPLGRTTNFVYDAAGNLTSKTTANHQSTRYEYDLFNRLTAVITPNNERTEYSYLQTGEIVQIKDAMGNVSSFSYDTLGRMISKTDSLGFVTTRSYDANGNLIQEIDPNGNAKAYIYNSLNQLVQKTLPDNVVSLSYDSRKNLTHAKNQQSEVDFTYDVGGRLIATQSQGLGNFTSLPNVTLSFGRDANGNRTTLTDPVGTTTFSYDELDHLTSIANPKGELYSFSYDGASRLVSLQRPGGQTNYGFDDSNLLSTIVHSSGGSQITSFAFQRDLVGNVTQITTANSLIRSLSYDNDSQLKGATNPEATANYQTESFGYDSISNRTSDQIGGYIYDSKAQRLTEDYRYQYFYDNNGNLIKSLSKTNFGDVTNYSYSSENQLIAFQVFSSGSSSPAKEVTYTYDAIGRRVQKQVIDHNAPTDPEKSYTRQYVYDGQEILLEYDGNSQILARYTHSSLRSDDILAADISSAGVNSGLAGASGSIQYLKDGQGSIIDITDSSGNRIQHYIYSAFGEILGIKNALAQDITASPVIRTSFTFTGREYDSESGFYYYRARYYDSNTGRFIQKDPDPGSLNIPTTVVNSYAYVANNPSNLLDPTGRSFWSVVGEIFVGAVIIGAAVLTGGLAGAAIGAILGGGVLGAVGGAVAGAIVGGLVGGIVGGVANVIEGKPFAEGFWHGAILGAIAGGLAGAVAGYSVAGVSTASSSGDSYLVADAGGSDAPLFSGQSIASIGKCAAKAALTGVAYTVFGASAGYALGGLIGTGVAFFLPLAAPSVPSVAQSGAVLGSMVGLYFGGHVAGDIVTGCL